MACMYVFKIAAILAGIVICLVSSGPLHASCKIDWQFGESCDMVKDAIVSQIKEWNGADGCKNGGEKCLYVLKSETDTEVKATHETPIKHYVDSLTFSFTPSNKACKVHGFSSSGPWYAVLDYGTNYCNLRNLVSGAGLDKATGFVEDTSDNVCTQFSSHNCTRY